MNKNNFYELFNQENNFFDKFKNSENGNLLENLYLSYITFMNHYLDFISQNSIDTGLMQSYAELGKSIMSHPQIWMELQSRFYQNQFKIWIQFWDKQLGNPSEDIIKTTSKDKRFKVKEWEENPVLDFIKQSYLLVSEFLMEVVKEFPIDEEHRKKLAYYTRQFVSAISPTNFALTNPEVINTAIETKGQSLINGFQNLMKDIQKGRVTMTDESKFEVGKNVAVTEGSVVFQNELIQLIQYKPLTDKVKEFPFIILPPWINKYYILDLTPENSYAKYIVEQGYTVFMVSWKSADESIADFTWEDYISKGAITAIDAVKSICDVKKVNVLGFCIGGTLLGNTLAVLKKKKNNSVNSATLLATMLDFSDTGEISAIVDRFFVEKVEREFENGGVFEGNKLANTFATLRENELLWNYVVNNYLKGETPIPFDLLYWNSDPTNLPGKMYSYYLRNMYLENNLVKPNCFTHLGQKVDISAVNVPTCFIATLEDHIAPWKTVYKSFLKIGGEKRFILGASGHIAGIVNHPAKKKRNYWVNENYTEDPDEWLKSAESKPGSWWSEWILWLHSQNPNEVDARQIQGEIEPAPGSYVKERL